MYQVKYKKHENIFLPCKSKITGISHMGNDVKLFRVISEEKTDYMPGQFFMVSTWGAGEVPISVTSVRKSQKLIEFAIKRAGTVTTALHKLKRGGTLWLRGPYGNGFNTAAARKKDVLIVAGGIGIVPLRPLINIILQHKKQHREIFLLYGAKNPSGFLFERDMATWRNKGVDITVTVDRKDKLWKGNVGLVTEHMDKIKTDFRKAHAYVCGPDIMIENTMKTLSLKGMPDRNIITTLEARMKCGTGKCGQCYHGTEYICTNGPVYTYEEIKKRKAYGP
ncbi:MAG: FAD/NAD(P)-binding protein [Nitrospiraceae bacterium]|nr:MAG: FAD/NAD(P)-binding protein [Nitrospiraceae bacterium]